MQILSLFFCNMLIFSSVWGWSCWSQPCGCRPELDPKPRYPENPCVIDEEEYEAYTVQETVVKCEPKCEFVPHVTKVRRCRYLPKVEKVKCVKYVPQYVEEEVMRYEPEYYYEDCTNYCARTTYEKKEEVVEKTYYRRKK